VIRSLLSSQVRRSVPASVDLPELGIARGDLLHYDPDRPGAVYHSRRIAVEDLVAAIRRRSLVASGAAGLVQRAPAPVDPSAPSPQRPRLRVVR